MSATRKLARFAFATTTALSALAAGAPAADASSFQASPVRVQLGPTVKSDLVAVVNQGTEPLQIQVAVFAWDEASNGQMLLSPSSGLTVFPTMLTLAPGETKRVRVGITGTAPALETTYRLIVQELPPASDQATTAIAVRLRMSIPVFVQPGDGKAAPQIEDARVEDGKLRFALTNTGSRFYKASKIHTSLVFTSGTAAIPLDGWYVLRGGRRDYALDVPPGACVTRAIIRVETEDKASVERTFELTGACR